MAKISQSIAEWVRDKVSLRITNLLMLEKSFFLRRLPEVNSWKRKQHGQRFP